MLIAITQRTDFLDNKYRYYCNYTYLSWLSKSGHNILLINEFTPLSLVLKYCDMLLISGGYDIHPSFYKQSIDETYPHYDISIDKLDFLYLKAFHQAHKPVLGICRGLQIINVYFHGTLFQDIKHHMDIQHPIYFHSKSKLSSIYPSIYICNSYHHQSIDRLGKHVQIEAISSDGIIEAISYKDYIIGVQWHPELQKDDPILSYFSAYFSRISQMHK